MRVLVTGANGQVGRSLTTLLANQCDLLAIDREQLDICNEEQVQAIFSQFKPQVVVNAAAYTAVDKAESETDLAYQVNEYGPKLLAQACQNHQALLVHISTDYVFSGDKQGVYSESDAVDPQSIYGASKLAGELAVQDHCKQHYIIRTAWVFSEYGNNFVKTMLRLGAEREQLGIVADQFGGPTYAGDIAKMIVTLIDRSQQDDAVEYGLYHFSGLPQVSWFEFAEAIFSLAQEQGVIPKAPHLQPLTTDQYPTAAKRPFNSKLDTCKIETNVSVQPSNWKVALNTLQHYIEQ